MIVASAPGKLMLMGEHAVLYGHSCLVAAVSARATARLTPRADSRVVIHSELGELTCDLDDIVVREPFAFVLQSILSVQPTVGFDLDVACDFPADVGLGSSSAITVATVGALKALQCGSPVNTRDVFDTALAVVQAVQGTGSGADLAAATYGGVLHYSVADGVLKTVPTIPLTVVYSGSKEKTAVVIEKVRRAAEAEPALFNERFRTMGDLVDQAVRACENDDLVTLGQLVNDNQTVMADIGVSNARLDEIVNALRRQPGIFGAKISGSGLGDCVIGVGNVGQEFAYKKLPVTVTDTGLEIETGC